MLDLLLKDARVVDGTGQTWFRASVGVEGDQASIMRGDSSAIQASRIIEASQYVSDHIRIIRPIIYHADIQVIIGLILD